MVEGKYLKSYDYHPSIGVAGTALTKSAREAMTFTHALAKSVASSISADEGPETRVVQRGELGRNPPPQLYRAIGVDSSGQRRPIGTGPVGAMRETAMASWLGDPSMRSAYVVDRLGHSHLTLEPRDRSRLQGNGRVSPEMLKEWDRVNYAVRLAEKSGDYRAAEAAKAEVNRVYREMQNVRLGISPNAYNREALDELPDDAVTIADGIAAAIDRALDWRVYEELRDGRWRLIDVKPTLRSVRQQYAPDENEP
jgi:hypothetical protein